MVASTATVLISGVAMTALPSATTNRLLAALPEAVLARWMPMLEPVSLPLGKVLYQPGDTVTWVYFPTSAIVSLLYVTREGESTEVALIGNDGIVGVSFFMSGKAMLDQAVVQNAGHAFRIRTCVLMADFEQIGPVKNVLVRYTQALMSQMEQTAVCNRLHRLDQQLCRWLLASDEHGPHPGERSPDDPGTLGPPSRCPARERDRCGGGSARRGAHPIRSRPHPGARPRGAGTSGLRML